ncbi:gonadal somatic cell derived factor isoform X1 [Syngnathus acus]|uniref:gonadal somatic cell derived factor isoform X1 n=1 Tax=Syngnathus acus TaxID=161584 RepID=UPI0018860BE1|nr:gonadal somatic cell derived factor isoform X1 [Syngnathus acus]
MSFAFIAVMALMCSSVVIAFVLQPGQEDAIPQDSDSRCCSLSLQSIRKELLAALNLQTEPRLPEGAKKQWSETAERLKALEASSNSSSDDGGDTSGCCSRTSEVLMSDLGWDNWMIFPERVTLVHCAPCGHSASCRPQPTATQRDDLEVVFAIVWFAAFWLSVLFFFLLPQSTPFECFEKLRQLQIDKPRCCQHQRWSAASLGASQSQMNTQVQAPCCQPIAQNPMPVMYRDEWNTMVITSMHLTRRCGCPAALQPSQE